MGDSSAESTSISWSSSTRSLVIGCSKSLADISSPGGGLSCASDAFPQPSDTGGDDRTDISVTCRLKLVCSRGEVNPLLGGSATKQLLCPTSNGAIAGSCGEPSGKGSLTSISSPARKPGALEYLQLLDGVSVGSFLAPTRRSASAVSVLASSGLVGSLESMEPMGEDAKRTSRRKEAFAFWNSLCICAT
jgi:hypothetical protein